MSEQNIEANGINLWTESFGDSKDPCILLIMGAGGQGILWTDSFCQALAAQQFHVIRFDNRDVGLSTCINFGIAPYTLKDMAHDALGVMDHYKIQKAHIVGTSMGGYIAQLLAIHYPERVETLTLIMSTVNFTPLMNAYMGNSNDTSLPPAKPETLVALKGLGAFSPANQEEWLEKSLRLLQIFNGPCPIDPKEWTPLLLKVHTRLKNPAAASNHMFAIIAGPSDYRGDICQTTIPTLIIHGSDDPIIPVEHAIASAETIPNSTLKIIEGMGHGRPMVYDSTILEAILNHIKQSI